MREHNRPPRHIVLTSHPRGSQKPVPVHWGAADPLERGPVIGTFTDPARRNVIGAHAGSYALYRALAIAAGSLSPVHRPDLTDTSPAVHIGPHPQWSDPYLIVSLDPLGHLTSEVFGEYLTQGWDIRPTIAITRARLTLPELLEAMGAGRLKADGRILTDNGEVNTTKAAIEPVWYLPGVAERCGAGEGVLRRSLFEQTGGMFPELVTRPDLHLFLPPIGGITVYAFGDLDAISDPRREVACRVHDECNGSDVFGSDICTCRPYLTHGIEVCVRTAQAGGVGIIVYNRKEGRALGEVTKFLVYNARKRHHEGDNATRYFERTECVAGVQDVRFQELMPDVLHWLGVKRIDHLVSMSNLKYDALVRQGIEIVNRVPIPEELIPDDARVEMEAKRAAGYFSESPLPEAESLKARKGRGLTDYE
ncbi:MAG: GTP cyclohydrolase II [Gammaproteobacteria bacterium]|nr:GTP cyclohydrolase II [Gammaproteobacteria bacterium]NIR85725.1 GTP cyclohydrolase II [Gammaproteobacteria bacterium]NIR90258.1 GTP cyclohydrolase II [Gammaproteobacteria bacterium]NIU06859.1 GTP cyclohydrolase II [Gammaproteobacteria bacterium]NIV53792.1 GTP cyclohydrolase II [Gammaproteobacteria bacterium]